ncbi:MAG: hypothetical protein IJ438_08745 [Clostridia bacterium]|nr:hypothetical protein [Clostridia bacterium]
MKQVLRTSFSTLFLLLILTLLCLGSTALAQSNSVYCDSCENDEPLTPQYDANSHLYVCELCGSERRGLHWGFCDQKDLSQCVECAAEDVILDELFHQEWVLGYDTYYHWPTCAHCGAMNWEETSEHSATCPDLTTCTVCEVENIVATSINHDWDDRIVEGDETHHWIRCTACSTIVLDPVLHKSDCTNPTVCSWCDMTDVTFASVDHDLFTRGYIRLSDTHCQPVCADCNEPKDEPQPHWADCTAPDTCTYCDSTGITAAVLLHDYSDEWSHNDTEHWYACLYCDARYDVGAHEAYSCSNITTCTICDAADITTSRVHVHRGYLEGYDNTHHWEECSYCGAMIYHNRHTAKCTDPSRCISCEARNADCVTQHVYEIYSPGEWANMGPIFSDERGHWWVCAGCGDETPRDHDYDEDSVCTVCNYKLETSLARIPGDVNDDGKVDMRDALALLKKLADWDVTINESNSDVNGDGAVNMRDALTLLKYLAEWDIELK